MKLLFTLNRFFSFLTNLIKEYTNKSYLAYNSFITDYILTILCINSPRFDHYKV